MLKYNLDIEDGSLWLRSTPTELALKQPFYCTEAGIFLAGKKFDTIRDYKDSYLLFLTMEGCGIIEQNGTAVKLMPHQALFMNCRSPQTYYTDPEAGIWRHYWAHIDGTGIQGLEPLLIPDQKLTAMNTNYESLRMEFDNLLKNLENTSSETILSISLSIHRILTDPVLYSSTSYSANQQIIMKTADYIRARCCENIQLETLLDMAGMSKSYYMRLFRRYTGTTPYNYALSLRITKAREMLEMTDMTIHEIAMETGFSDDAAFSTRFSAMAGMSPLKYRKSAITRQQSLR